MLLSSEFPPGVWTWLTPQSTERQIRAPVRSSGFGRKWCGHSHRKKKKRGRKKPSHVRRDHNWSTRAFQNSAKLCGITWNARVLLHEMRVCSRRSLVRNFQDSFTANCTGSDESVQHSVTAILTNEKREHTRIPCNATQFGGMRMCFNCDRSSPVKNGKVFLLPNYFPYSMVPGRTLPRYFTVQ
jgi:hypothetical protein